MLRARLWNEDSNSYEEPFKGKIVKIPGKGTFDEKGLPTNFVVMDFDEATQFKGQYTPIRRDGLGRDLAPKALRFERLDGKETKLETIAGETCNACGDKFTSKAMLVDHVVENHKELLHDSKAVTSKGPQRSKKSATT